MSVRSGQSITTVFTTTRFDTGAATNGDSTPTGTLYVNGTADAATVTVTNLATGVYKAAVTLPTLAVGDVVNIVIAATVNSVAGKGKVWEDTKDIVIDSAGLADATAVKIGPSGSATGQTARDIGASVLLSSGTGTGQLNFTTGVVQADAAKIATDATAATNLKNQFNGTGYIDATAPARQDQVDNIAVTGAALNATAGSEVLTTGTDTGGVANTSALDGVFDNWADAAGTIDGYYQFDLSGTTNAVGVGATWNGYLVGIVNTLKVYAYNWGSAGWDQIGSITGIAQTLVGAQEFDLTTAHTGTGGNNGLVRIRFQNSGLTAATLKTDRILLGYVVTPNTTTPPTAAAIATAIWQDATAGDFTTSNSIGKALYIAAAPGAAGGHSIAGSNAATTFASLTVTGAFSINGVSNVSQTGDSFARLGAPAGASISADIAEIEAETDMLLAGVTVSDKTGFSLAATGLDAISVADPGAPSAMTTLPRMLVAIWRSVFKKKTLTSSAAKFFADDGSTANATSVVSDDGTTQQWGSMS